MAEGRSDSRLQRQGSKTKAVILLGHGLNLQPVQMDRIAGTLQDAGYLVIRPGFTGHCGDSERYARVRAEQWLVDASRHAALAERLALEHDTKLMIVAYSFSALLYELTPMPKVAARVYLAPGIETRPWYSLVRLVRYWPFPFRMESLNLPEFRANERMSLSAFRAMDELLETYHTRGGPFSRDATLVIMDPEDELVDFEKVRKRSPAQWTLERVSNGKCTLRKCFHHLIISEEAIGTGEWKRMRERIVQFLGTF